MSNANLVAVFNPPNGNTIVTPTTSSVATQVVAPIQSGNTFLNYIGLADVSPQNYSGLAGYAAVVNGSETGMTFADVNGELDGKVSTSFELNGHALTSSSLTLTTTDISDSTDARYVTDAELVVIGNTSGINTGDETQSSIESKLAISSSNLMALQSLSGINTGDETAITIETKLGVSSSNATALGNLYGINTGDETQATIKSKLGIASSSSDGYLLSTDWSAFNDKVSSGSSSSITGDIASFGNVSGNSIVDSGLAILTVTGHISNTSNPHNVTASQVGNGMAQWNANELQGIAISSSAPSTNQALVYNGAFWSPSMLVSAVSSVFGRTGAVTAQSGDYSFSQISSTPTTIAGYGITDAVAAVTGTSPIVSSGGTSPAISIPQATASASGYLASSDWTLFNGKQSAYTILTTLGGLSNTAGYLKNDGSGNLSWGTPSGSGNVTGPSSSVSGNFASYNGTSGEVLADSGYSASSFQSAATILSTFAALANSAGWLYNDASGNLSYSVPTKSTVGLGSVENTALSTWTGSANLVTLGTIATGAWNGTAIGIAYGGTGATTAASARSNLGAAGSGANSDITSLTGLTTPLSAAQGGTGLAALGTAGQVLTVNSGATAAIWATPSGGSGSAALTDTPVTAAYTQTATGLLIRATASTASDIVVTLMTPPSNPSAQTNVRNESNQLVTLSGAMLVKGASATTYVVSPKDSVNLVSTGSYWVVTPAMNFASPGSMTSTALGKVVSVVDNGSTSTAVDANTAALYHLDSSLADASSYSRTATVSGTTAYTTTTSKFGTAALSLASSSYLSIPNDDGALTFTGDFTVEAFFYEPGSAWGGFFSVGSGGTSTTGEIAVAGEIDSTAARDIFNYYGGSITGTAARLAGQYYHLCLMRSGTNLSFYVNGVPTCVATSSAQYGITGTPWKIGYSGSNTNYYFPGYVDEVRISNIARYSTSGFTAPSSVFGAGSAIYVYGSSAYGIQKYPALPVTTISAAATAVEGNTYVDATGCTLTLTAPATIANGAAPVLRLINQSSSTATTLAAATSIIKDGSSSASTSGSVAAGSSKVFLWDSTNSYWVSSPGSGVTSTVSIAQGGTGLAALGTAGQVLTVNSGATAAIWATPSGGSGSGDVTGPSSSADANFAAFNGSTGKIVKDSGYSSSSFIAAPASGIDSYTTLMLHADGTSGSTTFTDSSTVANTVVAHGTSAINTSYYKFGTGSAYVSAGTAYLSIADSAGNFIFPADFTIDFWFYDLGSSASYPDLIGSGYTTFSGSGACAIRHISAGAVRVHWSGVGDAFLTSSSSFANNVWHHVAFARLGTTCYLFVDGTLQASGTSSATCYFSGSSAGKGSMYVGRNGWDTSGFANAYIDELRVSKGIARWTGAFATPSLPYDSGTGALAISTGGTGATSASAARTSLGVPVDPAKCPYRLSLDDNYVMSSDVTGATSIYANIGGAGNLVSLYDTANSVWYYATASQLTLSISSLAASTLYDIYLYNSGTVASPVLALQAIAWSASTAGSSTRATALDTSLGVPLKSGALGCKYLGTILTASTAGTCDVVFSSSTRAPVLGVWNYYNRELASLARYVSDASWTYATASWRQVAANAANECVFATGLPSGVKYSGTLYFQTGPGYARGSIGVNSTTTPQRAGGSMGGLDKMWTASSGVKSSIGLNYISLMEYADSGSISMLGSTLYATEGIYLSYITVDLLY